MNDGNIHVEDGAALETFLTEHPELRSHYEILSHMSGESPRGMVLIAAAELDRILLELLKRYLKSGVGQNALLSDTSGPLGTFSGKIAVAQALNLISEREFRDMNIIRRIRNDFAHSTSASFESETTKNRVRELSQFNNRDTEIEIFEVTIIKLTVELEALIRGLIPIEILPQQTRKYDLK